MLVGIHHTAISTPDLDRCATFYRDLFGFETAFDFSWDASNENFKRTHAEPETIGHVVMPVPQAHIKCCYGRDPDGNLIELIEHFDHVVDGSD